MKNMKKFLFIVLTVCMVLGLASCKKGEAEPTPTPSDEVEPTPEGYVYGMAGDMFRQYVNAVAGDDFDTAIAYTDIKDGDLVTKEDLKRYLMSQKIGNLIGEVYSTYDIAVSEEGSVRAVKFYYITKRNSKPDDIDGYVILDGTDWKVYLPELYTNEAKLVLPKDSYKSIEIDGIGLDVNDFVEDGETQIYSLPKVSIYEKTVKIENSSGEMYEGKISWTYSVSKYGKVLDDGVRTLTKDDFKTYTPAEPEVPEEPVVSAEPADENVNTDEGLTGNNTDTGTGTEA